jgi:hypothetical protein
MGIDGFCELTLEARHMAQLESLYVEDPEGNVVEVWDFFRRGMGRRAGVEAFRS